MKSIFAVKKILVALAALGIIFSGAASAHVPENLGWWKDSHNHDRPGWWEERRHSYERPGWWKERHNRKHYKSKPLYKSEPRCSTRHLVFKIFRRAKIETLSDLSGKPIDKVREDIKRKKCCLLLEEYNVKASDFHTNLKSKKTSLLNKAVKKGELTEAEKDNALRKMNKRLRKHEAMRGFRGCPLGNN